MKKMISGVLAAGVLFSGAATQVVSANSNGLEQRFFQFADTKEVQKSAVEKKQNKKIAVYINGFKDNWYGDPIVRDNRVLIPLKTITSQINATVKKDAKTEKITVVHNNKKIVFSSGENVVYVNGEKTFLNVPVKTVKGTTYVSLDFASEIIGAKVKWDSESKVVDIITFEEISSSYYYMNKNGELGKPLTLTQIDNRYKQGIAEGREIVGNFILKNYVDNGNIMQTTHHYGKYNIDGTEFEAFLFVDAQYDTKKGSFSEIHYYLSVNKPESNNDGFRFTIDKEGTLSKDKFKTTQDILNYSAYDAINDLGIIEKISDK